MQKILYALSAALVLWGAFLCWGEHSETRPEAILALAAERRATKSVITRAPVVEEDNRWLSYFEALALVREIEAEDPPEGSLLYRVFQVEGMVDEENPNLSIAEEEALLEDLRVVRAIELLEAGSRLPLASWESALKASGRNPEEAEELLYGTPLLRFLVSSATHRHVREGSFERVVDLMETLATLSKDMEAQRSLMAEAMAITLGLWLDPKANVWNDLHALDSLESRLRLDGILQDWEAAFLNVSEILEAGFEENLTNLESAIESGIQDGGYSARGYLQCLAFEEELQRISRLDLVGAQEALAARSGHDEELELLCLTLDTRVGYRKSLLTGLRTIRFGNAHFMPEESRVRIEPTLFGGTFEVAESEGRTLFRYRNAEGEIERELAPRD